MLSKNLFFLESYKDIININIPNKLNKYMQTNRNPFKNPKALEFKVVDNKYPILVTVLYANSFFKLRWYNANNVPTIIVRILTKK